MKENATICAIYSLFRVKFIKAIKQPNIEIIQI